MSSAVWDNSDCGMIPIVLSKEESDILKSQYLARQEGMEESALIALLAIGANAKQDKSGKPDKLSKEKMNKVARLLKGN